MHQQEEKEERMAAAAATILRKRIRRPASVDTTITVVSSLGSCSSSSMRSTCGTSSQRLSIDSRSTFANAMKRKKRQQTTTKRRRRMHSLDGSTTSGSSPSSSGSLSSSFRFGRIFLVGIVLVTLVQAQDDVPFFNESPAPMAAAPGPAPTPLPAVVPIPTAPVAPPPPPTDQPVVAPTDPPTKAPTTDAPTKNPTKAPVTPQPTDNPTRAPVTQQPSDRPSLQPSLLPSQMPSLAPSKVPTAFPTKSNSPTSVTPAPTISPAPTGRPSPSPSRVPTATPSAAPSRQPTTAPSRTPSQSPSSAPSLQPQSQEVNVVMRLENTRGRLSGAAEFDFQAASEQHLQREIENSVKPPGLVKLIDIQCRIYGQTVVQPRPPEETNKSDSNRNLLQQRTNDPQLRPRTLQSQQPLRVGFKTFIKFQSEADRNIVSDWVGECFNSVSKRQAYMDRLKRTNAGAFSILTGVTVLVEGEKPEEEVPPPPIVGPDDGGSGAAAAWILVAAVAGGVLVAFFVGILVYNKHKSKQRQDEMAMQSKYSKQQQQQQHGDSYNNESTSEAQQQFAAEIHVERQDDISTLGDPVGLAGMNMATGAHGEDRTASVASNYDYALQFLGGGTLQGRGRVESAGEDSDAFEVSHNSSSALNIHGPGGLAATHAVFADDASFDEVFDPRDKDSDDDADDDENMTGNGDNGNSNKKTVKNVKFRIDVPCGKLGMVIDTPNGGAPMVHAMKPDSVLADRLQPGDYLVEFDGQDVRKLSAVAVSQLISEKSDKERVMYFVRRVVVDATAGDDTVNGESRAC